MLLLSQPLLKQTHFSLLNLGWYIWLLILFPIRTIPELSAGQEEEWEEILQSQQMEERNEIVLQSMRSINPQNHKVSAISSTISLMLSQKAAFCPLPPKLAPSILDSLLEELQSTFVQCSARCFYSCFDTKADVPNTERLNLRNI